MQENLRKEESNSQRTEQTDWEFTIQSSSSSLNIPPLSPSSASTDSILICNSSFEEKVIICVDASKDLI